MFFTINIILSFFDLPQLFPKFNPLEIDSSTLSFFKHVQTDHPLGYTCYR